MPNSNSLQNELLLLENHTWVIYLENSYNKEINDYIKSNYHLIFSIYLVNKLNFIYLPYFIKSKTFKDIVDYNYPYYKTSLDSIPISEIYNAIFQKFNIKLNGSYLFLDDSVKNNLKDDIKPIDVNTPIFEQFYKFAYDNKGNKADKENTEISNIYLINNYKNKPNRQWLEYKKRTNLFKDISTSDLEDYKLKYNRHSLWVDLENELKKRNPHSNSISRIRIEIKKYCEIFFLGYEKKLKLEPLQMALYILFLKNPKGIILKEIGDYKVEFKKICGLLNKEVKPKSINQITDVFEASLNTNISKINRKIGDVMPEELAQNYYILGQTNKEYKINLPEEYIEYQYYK